MENLIEVSHEEMLDIIELRTPIGKFYRKDGNVWVGVDNKTGDAWTEEFKSKEDCLKWLHGEDLE